MPITYDELQTFTLLSFWIGHNRQDIRMAETLPDEEDDDEDIDEDDEDIDEDEAEDEDEDEEDDDEEES
jgi:hypothetical protein